MSVVGLSLVSVVALVGCGLIVAVVVLAAWAIMDNSRRKAPRDPEQ
jgi:hypothetical protein